MTGTRMAQTRGGNRCCTGCESSTNGFSHGLEQNTYPSNSCPYHQKCPDGVVEEDGGGEDEHSEADETIELQGGQHVQFATEFINIHSRRCWQPLSALKLNREWT